MKLIKVVFIGSVNCGGQKANTCADCPQIVRGCHGDCQWINRRCEKNLLIQNAIGKCVMNL